MRWIFMLLVLANAGFVAWQSFSASTLEVVQKPVYAPPVSERVYLVGEVRPELEKDVLPRTNVAVGNEEISVSAEKEKPPVSLEEQLNKAIADASIEGVTRTREDLLCPVVVLERDADRRVVTELFDANNLSFSQNNITGKRKKYWLYIAAPSNLAIANGIVVRLKQQNIDSYIIARGEMKNRISLGLYSSKERAEQAQLAIAKRSGMTVNVYEHERTVSLYELLLAEPIAQLDWEKLMAQLDMSKLLIKIEKNPC